MASFPRVQCLLVAILIASPLSAQNNPRDVVYQVVTDRFFDGDASNNNPAVSAGMYDATKLDWNKYWGGDLAGIEQKLDYISGMGATAIWISPPVDNIDVLFSGFAPYHGYSARDFKRIDEHFGDANKSWAAFDSLVAAAHAKGIKIIVDFAPNHTSPQSGGESGALYDDGNFVTNYTNDPTSGGYFHHFADIADFNSRFQIQYDTLLGLADLDQENPAVDAYLKAAVQLFQDHGADGFRLDAVKHTNWGWQYSLANQIFHRKPSVLYGEWFQGGTGDALYGDSLTFSRSSGISLLDFAFANAIRSAYGSNGSFFGLDTTNQQLENGVGYRRIQQFTFFDSHDFNRLQSYNNNSNARLEQAMLLILGGSGTPILYYGDEQYLHDDTGGGNDPYNRVMMSGFSTTTNAYQLVQKMAALRQSNDAVAFGSMLQRWVNTDVYIYERRFDNDVALIAVNKGAAQSITGLFTSLPQGTYADYLGGLENGGNGINLVVSDNGGNNPATAFTFPAGSAFVWQYSGSASGPQIGTVSPPVADPGTTVTILGHGFGNTAQTLEIGGVTAAVSAWSDRSITATVPAGITGQLSLAVTVNAANAVFPLTVLKGPQVPVRLSITGAPPLQNGENYFVVGDAVELGGPGAGPNLNFSNGLGPFLTTDFTTYFLNTSAPAGTTIKYRFYKGLSNSAATATESGQFHSYDAPASGATSAAATWRTATLNYSSASVDFGTLQIHGPAAQTLTLAAQGNAGVDLFDIEMNGNFLLNNGCGTTLAAGASCTLTFTFTPEALGAATGSVSILHDAVNGQNAGSGSPNVLPITGTGVDYMINLTRPVRPVRLGAQLAPDTAAAVVRPARAAPVTRRAKRLELQH